MKFTDILMAFLAVGMAILFFSNGLSLWVVLHYIAQGFYWTSRWLNARAAA